MVITGIASLNPLGVTVLSFFFALNALVLKKNFDLAAFVKKRFPNFTQRSVGH